MSFYGIFFIDLVKATYSESVRSFSESLKQNYDLDYVVKNQPQYPSIHVVIVVLPIDYE